MRKQLSEFPPSKERYPAQICTVCERERKCGPPTPRLCDQCGDTLVVTARRAAEHRVFCSRTCKDADKNAARSAALHAAKPERQCPHCGMALTASMRADAAYCSNKCMEAAHNATRKARWKVGYPVTYVSRAEIIERDDGRCHICGEYPDPDDLHLDHVIPLSLGGDHSRENLRVACARCNLSKGARLLVGGAT